MKKVLLIILTVLSFSLAAQEKSKTYKSAILTDLTTDKTQVFKIDTEVSTYSDAADVVVSINDGKNVNYYNLIKNTRTSSVSEKGKKIIVVKAINIDTKVKVYLVFTSDGKFAIRAKETQIIFLN